MIKLNAIPTIFLLALPLYISHGGKEPLIDTYRRSGYCYEYLGRCTHDIDSDGLQDAVSQDRNEVGSLPKVVFH